MTLMLRKEEASRPSYDINVNVIKGLEASSFFLLRLMLVRA